VDVVNRRRHERRPGQAERTTKEVRLVRSAAPGRRTLRPAQHRHPQGFGREASRGRCSPTAAPGTSGQFFFSCGQAPSAIDARTGSAIDIPGAHNRAPSAGSDVYVASDVVPVSSEDGPKPTDATLVIDPQGRIIDQVPGTYPASAANDGFVLVYGGGDTWRLRDYRKHQSMPVPIHLDTTYGLGDVETAWLRTSLAITMRSGAQPLLLVDPIHPVAEPTSAVAPCTRHELKRRIQAVAGAVILQCEGRSTRIVGLVP